MSWISLALLLIDGQESPLVVSAAADRKQASLIFEDMCYAIRRNKRLRDVLHVVPSLKTVQYPKRNGAYRALSADASTAEGLDCSAVLVDELHAWRSDALYRALQYATVARTNGLIAIITTAGQRKDTLCYDLYRLAKSVLDGTNTDTTFMPLVYEAPDDADVMNPEHWRMANPSLGQTISEDRFREDAEAANSSTTGRLSFLRYRLGRWVTFSENSFLPLEEWDACQGAFPEALAGQQTYYGLDLASTRDLCALAAVTPFQGRYYCRAWGWAPDAAAAEREQRNLARYQGFQSDGTLFLTPGNATDYSAVRRFLSDQCQAYPSAEVVADKWGALETLEILKQEGHQVMTFPQLPSYYTEPVRKLESLVLERKIVHDGGSLLRWCIHNVVLKEDSKGYVMPDREKSSDKIDLAVALLMALSRAVQASASGSLGAQSVYESRGLALLG